MTISGTYLDRFISIILPIVLLVSVILIITTREIYTLLVGIIIALLIWLLDTIILYKKYNKPVQVKIEKQLLVNNEVIDSNDILSITPITDNRIRWDFKLVTITLSDNRIIHFIEKPQFFIHDIMDKPSKSIQLIIDNLPELKEKIQERKYV
ncbi:hypothetical protein [Brumimicrobium aurantiacum]|uniref:PH domain-containing protein n=1 Tax=Brumimicrobium aurantiacum TaxID=1737063 RepID=A0A3E1EVZ8_9FLAO|nr:hypothetical protein [Brumimicrobium aurantiacum]RFC53663.1 hypothetical protein DXU93_11075 [Brumimicrobium aurantiacum]